MTEPAAAEKRNLRCAIYTRKSTEEGLEQAFNTLQAQREAGEAYVQSQRQTGWIALPEHFDDGGFSGASLERPALQRLMDGIERGQIDCVVVYKVDRLSRSLLDFARLMERFDRRGVSFVSVTQDFNTTTSLGRLTLNILLSFAQFEREIISERTRDKLSAARRKGKWIGGWPVLGYDVDMKGGRLLVNVKEAAHVREIFKIAARAETLEAALHAVHARGIKTKVWSTRDGKRHSARMFNRTMLQRLLSNVLYTGSVNHKGTLYPGEHERVVEQSVWEEVNAKLVVRSEHQRGKSHRRQEAPLRGILYCAPCGSAMAPSFTTKRGQKYRYYGCRAARGREGGACTQGSVAAVDLETFLLHKLEPVLGSALSWENVHASVRRIEYGWNTNGVAIDFKDGTRWESEMPMPNRPGAHSGESGTVMGRVPRVSRLLALAIKFERLIREGTIRHHRDIAQAGRISGARLSQIMSLTELAPSIQEELLFLPRTTNGPDQITEKALRQVARSLDWDTQKRRFAALKAARGKSNPRALSRPA
ncbi:MAG TPA: recombinase family protein [Bryobacteraceae bacterium]|jgi:DNA invertase Pin-like site-specific DNA recombinase